MADPLALIALGAGVGGVAGKFAEKAWEAGERWLATRFGEHGELARLQARRNAAAFVFELASSVKDLEGAGGVGSARVSEAFQHPQFSALLQESVLRAAQTNQRERHALLACLVAARIASNDESLIALASQMACSAIGLATARQVRVLALCSFLEGIRPSSSGANPPQWLDIVLRQFEGLPFYAIDAMHLTALSCISYDPTSERSLTFLLCAKIGSGYQEDAFEGSLTFGWLEGLWDGGLAGVALTSVGSLVGALAYDRITGAPTGVPHWDGA